MARASEAIVKESVVGAAVEPAPIEPGDIVSGAPEAQATILRHSEDKTLFNGIWHCTPGVFYLPHDLEETATIIEGRATVTPEGGEPVELTPGDTVFFPAGTRVLWDVKQTVRKAWHIYDPDASYLP